MKKIKMLCIMVVGLLFLLSSSVYSTPFLSGSETSAGLWTATDSEGRDASALFEVSGGMLNITITNNAGLTGSNTVPPEVLMGIFFSLGDGCTISNPHVEVAPGSNLYDLATAAVIGGAGFNLGGEYGYRAGIDPATNFGFGEYGVSASSLNPGPGAPAGWIPFGETTLIDPPSLSGAAAPNGPDYGMIGAGAAVGLPSSIDPYVLDSVLLQFTLDGTCDVEKVTFIYGTSMVPEPATMLLLGTGLLGLAGFRRKFRNL